MRPEFERLFYGSTHKTIYMPDVRTFSIPLPPIPEQRAIVDFLDRETARIDALIAKQEELIERIEEKRRAVINHAVTRGLDPNVPMKDSGMPWIGEVPVSWEVTPLRRIIRLIQQGWSPVAEDRQADNGCWGVIKTSAIYRGDFYSQQHKALPSNVAPNSAFEIKKGDVLMTRGSGSRALVGDVALVREPRPGLMLSDLVYRLEVEDDKIDRDLLVSIILSRYGRFQIERESRGIDIKKISQEAIYGLIVVLPPRDLQQKLMCSIREQTDPAARTADLAVRVIEFLRERRTALITAAVTGQIDVASRIAAEAVAA